MVDPRLFAPADLGSIYAQGQQIQGQQEDRQLRLGEMMARQQAQQAEAQREAGQQQAQTFSRLATAVRQRPYAERRAMIQSMAPQLQQLGISPEDIAAFDPTDQQLEAYIALGGAREQQPTSLQRDYEFIQGRNPELAEQFLRNRAEGAPIVANNGDGTFTIVPRSQVGGGQSTPQRETTAVNPQTGERIRLNPQTGQWEPAGGAGSGAPAPFSVSALDHATAIGESGNRDFANGQPVRSSAGAMYAMQVMPSTARDPGFGIAPARGNSPAEYNRVGREYRRVMERRYGGDLIKMWAAYNWGPGALDNAIRRYGDNWLQHAPRETRDYIQRNLRAIRRR